MAGPAYRLCRTERRGVLLVALVRRLLEEGEGPRELKRVRFYHRCHMMDSSAMDSAASRVPKTSRWCVITGGQVVCRTALGCEWGEDNQPTVSELAGRTVVVASQGLDSICR